jgi:signal transduction histidine kinase
MSSAESPVESAAPRAATVASPPAEVGRRSLRRLRVVVLIAPLVLVVILEGGNLLLEGVVSRPTAWLVTVPVALIVAAFFSIQVFDQIEAIRRRLARQNDELLGLHRAGLAVAAELSLDSVLQTVVDTARALIGTRYGAVSVIDAEGRIHAFVTSGISREVRERLGDPPRGHGLLGVVLQEGQRLRLDNLQADSRSVGFPPHHPPMRTLLAVPVNGRGPHRGNLYLSERDDGSAFTESDEETLVRFASQAAIALDNAHLHGQVRELGAARERIRIAHEMHDGLAQVLAYVNTKAQVVGEYCRQEKLDLARQHLDQLADAARRCYGDVREHILELRTTVPSEIGLVEAVTEYVTQWERQSGIAAELAAPARLVLAPDVELQLLRILQESLANVRKHAGATRVRVSLEPVSREPRGGTVRLTVVDDGAGFPSPAAPRSTPGAGPRFGLSTMQERAESVGGHLDLTSTPGEGTRVSATLPASQEN